ncbi:hypothetical protein PNOK_0055500 [Pyrrhoderma noxium]|uniref:Phosphatidylinositide phosphatase SAC2 n=1 Tax=Pyrrhoderma noxium TaxID=2282107 RepID=A0A286UV79_9AGAM|nr:hypothetical protein PNOK_0055500 [Pyrrhoderma noxium]
MKKIFRTSQKSISSNRDNTQSTLGGTTLVGLQPRLLDSISTVLHPTPYYRIATIATEEGLLIRPLIPGVRTPETYLRIPWGDKFNIEELSSHTNAIDPGQWSSAAVTYGILGCLELTSCAYLLLITSITDVGHFLDTRNGVHCIKSVSAIPLEEAKARKELSNILNKVDLFPAPSETSDLVSPEGQPNDETFGKYNPHPTKVKFSDTEDVKVMTPLVDSQPTMHSETSSGVSTPTSEGDDNSPIAKVIASRLSFWTRLSQRPTLQNDGKATLVNPENLKGEEDASLDNITEIIKLTSPPPTGTEERYNEMDDKILKECIKEFTKGVMFFAYNFDITTSLQHKQHEVLRLRRRASSQPGINVEDHVDILAEPQLTQPLWRRVTKQFWWNENLLQPFINSNLHPYILPVMQGFFQIANFYIPREPVSSESGESAPVDYIVVSRRSRDRAGLRYQRRGIDDDANVANFVETEAIVRVEREGISNVFSHIQIRGSVPLFWAQSGISLKPPPVLSPERDHQQNLAAMRRHFSKTIPKYGMHTVINLAEKHGKEANLTTAYRECVHELSSKDIRYIEYDFHAETKGMKYEKVASFIQSLERTFDLQGFFWVSGERLMSEQKAVFRVNCVDCLDRTNVFCSAVARHMLNKQLGAVALLNPISDGHTEVDTVFNDIWANNGDAISKAYAGTSALKGDFTRTGKRDLAGMLNDGMNSLARMYSSTFSDWFSQAVIDFMLGYRTLSVFTEFLVKLQSTDPRERVRIDKIRTEAIADAVSRVLPEGETLLSGWTLLSPAELNARVSEKLEEKILLLSIRSLYVVSYDYSLGKVARYTEIPLTQVLSIKRGPYILSTLDEGSKDPLQNYGFQETASPSVISTKSRGSNILSQILKVNNEAQGDTPSFVAFKALPVDPTRIRRTTGSFDESLDILTLERDCKQAVEIVVEGSTRPLGQRKTLGKIRQDLLLRGLSSVLRKPNELRQ